MAFNSREFGQRIRKLRKEHKISQQSLADEFGISISHLSKLESGHHNPSMDFLMMATLYFRIDPTYLLFGCELHELLGKKSTSEKKETLALIIQQLTELQSSL